jgi:hypothetical protein
MTFSASQPATMPMTSQPMIPRPMLWFLPLKAKLLQ